VKYGILSIAVCVTLDMFYFKNVYYSFLHRLRVSENRESVEESIWT
jgi:hypothetical protein